MGNPPDNNFPDIGGHGNHEYGNRVGIFRVLAVLDIHGIKPTFALDKVIADHYPFLIKADQKRDAEFIARGLIPTDRTIDSKYPPAVGRVFWSGSATWRARYFDQCQGSRVSIWRIGWSAMRSRTSAR
jgi:hypothetical protein